MKKKFFLILFFINFFKSKDIVIEFKFEVEKLKDPDYGVYFVFKEMVEDKKILIINDQKDFRIVSSKNFYEFLKELPLKNESKNFLRDYFLKNKEEES